MITMKYDNKEDTLRLEVENILNYGALDGEYYIGHGIFGSYANNKVLVKARIPFFKKTYLKTVGSFDVLKQLEEQWLDDNLPKSFSLPLKGMMRR